MAGFTNCSVGLVNRKTSIVSLNEILSGNYPISMQPGDINWQRLLATTG